MTNPPGSDTLSVVSPCYNESEVIELFYPKLKSALERIDRLDYEIIFVDDGSEDDTLLKLNQIAEHDRRVRVCSLSRNFGHQIALTAGMDAAAGDALVMLDSDLQHPPDLIPEMVERWRRGDDIVSAVRESGRGLPRLKDATSRGFYALVNKVSPTPIAKDAADFCLLSHRVYRYVREMREQHRFLRGLVSWTGFKRSFVRYAPRPRPAGRSKYTYRRMFVFALDGILSFSPAPLRLATRTGFVVTFLGLLYLVWIIVRAVVLDDLVPGWASLIGVTLILGGCQLVFIGLLGEYLARVFDEVKGRPLYALKQTPRESPWRIVRTREGGGRSEPHREGSSSPEDRDPSEPERNEGRSTEPERG